MKSYSIEGEHREDCMHKVNDRCFYQKANSFIVLIKSCKECPFVGGESG